MWGLLSDPRHAASFDVHGDNFAPLRRLVEQLATREYAGRIYAFMSLATFNLTTAPTYQESDGHDVLGIVYDPLSDLFRVDYCERAFQKHNPAYRCCDAAAVGEVIDRYVVQLLVSRQHVENGR